MTWYFHNTSQEVSEADISNYFGFVYIITHIPTGKKYIGKKFFTKSKTKQVKGKKKKIRVSSDWMDYWGSNKSLLEDVNRLGKDQFTREIIKLCTTRSECSYWETWNIFNTHSLMQENYYNEWVSCRIRKDHLIKRNTDTYKEKE